MIEAWTESPELQKTVLHRQPVRCEIVQDSRFVHLDAIADDGDRWLRLTLNADELHINEVGDRFADTARPVFAQCDLLAEAGFAAGAFDPPTLQVQPIARVTAATA